MKFEICQSVYSASDLISKHKIYRILYVLTGPVNEADQWNTEKETKIEVTKHTDRSSAKHCVIILFPSVRD